MTVNTHFISQILEHGGLNVKRMGLNVSDITDQTSRCTVEYKLSMEKNKKVDSSEIESCGGVLLLFCFFFSSPQLHGEYHYSLQWPRGYCAENQARSAPFMRQAPPSVCL